MSNAFTRKAVRRLGGWAVSAAVPAALLLSVYPANRLTAQSVLEQFSYDNLKPSALQLDVGPLGGSNIRGTLTGGLRLDYGLIAPHVRLLFGLSSFKAAFSAAARARFEHRLTSGVSRPTAHDTTRPR